MWALVVKNKVVEISESNPSGKFHPSMNWVAVQASVTVGMIYDGSSFIEESASIEQLRHTERCWRDLELSRVDVELNKVQDADPKAIESVADWRLYRKSLRSWPENVNFPDQAMRPKAPDKGGE